MLPRGGKPTAEEREVACILCRLPEMTLEYDRCRESPSFRWVVGRRRSRLDGLPHPLPPRSPVLPSPPPPGDEERGDCCGRPTSSADATPLSCPGSGGVDNNAGSIAAAPSCPRKRSVDNDAPPSAATPSRLGKHREDNDAGPSAAAALPPAKRRNEWVEEQRQKIALLVDEQANLKAELKEYGCLLESLRAINAMLKERAMAAPADAADNPRGAPNHLRHPQAAPPPVLSDILPAGLMLLAARPPGREVQSAIYKAAASREARKRRMEIRREKKSRSRHA